MRSPVILFLLALTIRIVAIFATGAGTIHFGDGIDYVDTAKALCATHAYPLTGSLPFFRAPGLPVFIALVTACHPGAVAVIKIALAVCDALTVVFIAELTMLLMMRTTARHSALGTQDSLGTRHSALGTQASLGTQHSALSTGPWLAGLLAVLNPFFILGVCDVRSEPLFMTLLTLGIWCLLRGRAAWAGIAVALASLVRPAGLVCIPLFALYELLVRRLPAGWTGGIRTPSADTAAGSRRPSRLEGGAPGHRRTLTFILAALLTLTPWTIRNAVHFHQLIVVNDAGGFNFWRGYAPEIMAIDGMRDREAIARASWEFDARRVAAARKSIGRDGWMRAGLDEVRRHPAAAVRWTLRKAWLYWRPWLAPEQYSWPVVAASGAFNLLLYAFAAIALVRLPDRRLAAAIVVYFAIVWLAHLPYQVVMRFRQPFTDPLLIALCLSRAQQGLWRQLRRSSSSAVSDPDPSLRSG